MTSSGFKDLSQKATDLAIRPTWTRYVVAIGLVAVACTMRVVSSPLLGTHNVYLTFYPAVAIAALYGGLRSGLLATILSPALAYYFWMKPLGPIVMEDPAVWLSLVIFLISCVIIIFTAEALHRSRVRALEAEAELKLEAERRRVEESLRESKLQAEFLGNVLELSNQPFGVGYLDGGISLFNPAFERLTGYSRDELNSINWITDLTPPEWREITNEKLKQLRLTGQPVRYEKEYIRKDGTRVPVELFVHLATDPDGKPLYYYSFITDITERKLIEKTVRESEARYRSLFENMTTGFAYHKVILDEEEQPVDYVFLEVNNIFEKLTGLKRSAVIGKGVREAIPGIERDPADWIGTYGKVALSRNEIRFEQYAESLKRWYSVAAYSPMKGYFVTLFDDITDRKQAEQVLLRSRDELEDLVKERTKELADSQGKLRSLYSHLQFLREQERASIAREIHDDLGQTMSVLKMDLLWIAGKLTGDNDKLKEQLMVDAEQVDETIQTVKRVCTELRPSMLDHFGLTAAIEWQANEFQERTGIKCEVMFDPPDLTVHAELTTPLFRIFQEALTNVLRHAKATEVKSSFKRTKSSIMVEIADNGIGIREGELSKPTSFGLLGMQERMYPWGGTVSIRGEKNKGTTVEVMIPLTTGDES